LMDALVFWACLNHSKRMVSKFFQWWSLQRFGFFRQRWPTM
jgi:hypothetical protein